MPEESLPTLVRAYKALADESRLRLLGLLATREHSVEELAAALDLRVPTVSHHLAKLKELGLVTMRRDGNSHLYRLDADALRALNRDVLTPERIAALADDIEGEAWERAVLRNFFDGDRLKEIPASRKKRLVILRWLAARFEPDTPYPERELNEIIKRHHPDAATLRRELIGYGLMQRDRGVYVRPSNPDLTPVPEAVPAT